MDFPALFHAADNASNKKQAYYLCLIRAEYALLFVAAVFSLNFLATTALHLAYTLVLLISLATLLIRSLGKPEQDWYRCRALAESVKTLSWRYAMKAAPFDNDDASTARADFRKHLTELFDDNRHVVERIGGEDLSTAAQITAAMQSSHDGTLEQRKTLYDQKRLQEQCTWYARKATGNKGSARQWMLIAAGAYLVAVALALSRLAYPAWGYWPLSPVIVFASSAIGWTQIKKFNELAAAYTVTAHEIGLIREQIDQIESEVEFSQFVNDAELALSREHTLWIARRTT